MINLMHGDCLELMKEIPDGSVDMVLTDPPYGITSCKWDSVIPLDEMWIEIRRIVKDRSPIALFGTEPFSSLLRGSNYKMFRNDWIWDKKIHGNPFLLKKYPAKIHEIISIFSVKSPNYYPIKVKREKPKEYKDNTTTSSSLFKSKNKYSRSITYTDKFPTSILTFSNSIRTDKLHPTQKPVALLEYLIKTYTNENQTVLDFTMGSGSAGIACLNTNRKFIGIEKDDHYFNVAKKRIEEHQTALSMGAI